MEIKTLDKIVEQSIKNFVCFLTGIRDRACKNFNIEGKTNYESNIILNKSDFDLKVRFQASLHQNHIEFWRGNAGGGNQLG